MNTPITQDQRSQSIVHINGNNTNFVIDSKTGLLLPQSVAESQSNVLVKSVQNSVSTLQETASYFELAGYRLEKQNHGVPQCPDIVINEKKASRTKPQAWSKEIDGQEHWLYNFPGVFAETKFLFPEKINTLKDLKKKIPEIDTWLEIFANIPRSGHEAARILNIPLIGYRTAVDDEIYGINDYTNLWSSSPEGVDGSYYAVLRGGSMRVYKNWLHRDHGMSLRFFANKK